MESAVTDCIISAMEHADEMQDVIIIYRLKADDASRKCGVGWLSTVDGTTEKVVMLEEVKHVMFMMTYGPPELG
jgi:hypothetical protein